MTRPELIEAMAQAIYEHVNGAGCRPWRQIDHKAAYRDKANAALAAIEAAGCVVVPGWRTMDSAPKGGTEVLAYQPWLKRAVIARYDDNRHCKNPRPYWSMSGRSTYDRDNQPTHWMPLPALAASPLAKDA